MSRDFPVIHIIGGGLGGCEASWQIAARGVPAVLHEMRPVRMTAAHKTGGLAELVCSNSFRSDDSEHNAVGLLHEEMRRLGSLIMRAADGNQVPAGGALAVDRDGFSAAISEAIDAGITSIEHGVFLTEEIVAHMRRDGTFLVPTLNAPTAIAAGGLAAGIPQFMVRKSEQVVPAHVASFQLAHRAGVRIAAGADSGTPLNFHGSLLPELALMVKYGMTPLEAIRSATVTAADCLGLGEVIGRVAPGYAADLIAVAGEPAERIEALADLKLVLVNGRVVVGTSRRGGA